MATILGITGAIGSGKTTVSEYLTELVSNSIIYESGQIVAELANSFNQSLKSELSFEIQTSDTELVNQALIWFTEAINEQLHQDVTWNQLALTRHRLAVHAEYYEKLFEYLKAIKANPMLVSQAITKENKAEYRALLQWLGGYLVAAVSKTIWFDEIFRHVELHDSDKELIVINGLRYPSDAETVKAHRGLIVEIRRSGVQDASTDITEVERTKIAADSTLFNDGSLEELQSLVSKLWLDITVSRLKKQYK